MRKSFLFALSVLLLVPASRAGADRCDAPAPVCAAAKNVVMISSFEPVGSAVILEKGLLVTNRHMVADNPVVDVVLADGSKLKARVAPSDYPGDLVELLAPDIDAAPLPRNEKISPDTTLYVIGFDVGRGAVRVYAPGHLIAPKADTPLARLHHDARSLPGNSGGALVDATGALVGIIASGGEGRNEAIPVDALPRLHASSGPDKIEVSLGIGR
ncbi:MAG: serine protease, partial [Rhodospirillales bacterium]